MIDAVSKETLTRIKEGFPGDVDFDKTYTGRFTEKGKERVDEDGIIVISKSEKKSRTLKWRTPPKKGEFYTVTAADLNGDSRKELFLMSRYETVVANAGSDGFEVITRIRNTAGIENVFISSGDIDNDGNIEVYLSRLRDGNPDSALIEFKNGGYELSSPRELKRRLVRVLDVEGEGEVLLGQRFRADSGFLRDLKVLDKKGDRFVKAGKYNLPRRLIKTGIFGFEIFNVTGGDGNEILSLDDDWHLRIYNRTAKGKWEKYWESAKEYGGTLNYIDLPEMSKKNSTQAFLAVKGNLKRIDLDSDGKAEVLVRKNVAGGFGTFAVRVNNFKHGAVQSISWDVALLEDNWKTNDHSGYVADFIYEDLNGDGAEELILLVVEGRGRLLKKNNARSHLVAYSLSPE
jgi:hypothetical protein